jgi:hypothetical protein
MTSDKMRSSFGKQRGKVPNNGALNATYIGNDRARTEERQHLFRQRSHLRERGAKNNQVRPGHSLFQVQGRQIHGASFLALFDTGRAANKAGDFTSQSSLLQAQTQ